MRCWVMANDFLLNRGINAFFLCLYATFWHHIRMSEVLWKLQSYIPSTDHLLQLQQLHCNIFCFVLDANNTRSFSLKRTRSAFLNIFFSHYVRPAVSNRHWRLLIITIPILPPSLIILKKYSFQNLIGKKNPTSHIFVIEQRLSNITFLCRRWCCFLSWSLHLNDTCLAPCHHTNYRLDASGL